MWQVEYTKRFLKELAALPVEIQSRVEPIVFQEIESENPFELGMPKLVVGCFMKFLSSWALQKKILTSYPGA